MITRTSCVVCGSKTLAAYSAVVSPFIAERIGWPPVECRLLECLECTHRFFDHALEDFETMRLYSDYRGAEYLRVRNRWEPWYTKRVNTAIGGDANEIATRRHMVSEYLRRSVPGDVLAGDVLDYGGDRGQFIPPEIGRTKCVYDLSGQATVEGVIPLRSEVELREHAFDLVLLCHVLEHVSDPLDFLHRLRQNLEPRSARHWLYVEVPLERHRIMKRRAGANGAARNKAPRVVRHRLPFLLADFVSTLARVKLGIVPPFGVIKLHEHVSFFAEASLRRLLERAGYVVGASESVAVSATAGIGKVLRIAGKSAE